MKKIVLIALTVSSFAIGGDLLKCSQAINMLDKYFSKWSDTSKITTELYNNNEDGYKFSSKKEYFYMHLRELWQKEAGKECQGILEGENYKFVSTGKFE